MTWAAACSREDWPAQITCAGSIQRFDGVVGYRICLTHRRSPVRAWVESCNWFLFKYFSLLFKNLLSIFFSYLKSLDIIWWTGYWTKYYLQFPFAMKKNKSLAASLCQKTFDEHILAVSFDVYFIRYQCRFMPIVNSRTSSLGSSSDLRITCQ